MPSRSVSWPLRISIVREPGGPLIDRGFGLIYDVDRNITWLQDANYARTGGRSRDGQMTWDDAMSWVASLDIFGVKGWRLPTALNRDGSGPCTGWGCRDSEFGHLVHGPWTTSPGQVTYRNFDASTIYWTSTESSPTEAHGFYFYTMRQGTMPKNPFRNGTIDDVDKPLVPVLAWPVHDGDVAEHLSGWRLRIGSIHVGLMVGRPG